MKKSLNILLAAGLMAAVSFGTANAGDKADEGLRKTLLKVDTVEALYPVDDFHTYIRGSFETEDGVITMNMEKNGETVIVEHGDKEPFVYKSRSIPSFADLRMPGNGEIRFAATEAGAAGDFASYKATDLFAHMTALCRKVNGHPVYVVPRNYGSSKRMTEVNAVEAFRYIASSGSGGAWELACEGKSKFLLSKDYNFGEDAWSAARFFSGRGLEGVNYIREDGRTLRASYDRLIDRETEIKAVEAVAFEVSDLKMGFVKAGVAGRYEGLYLKTDFNGCDIVSVRNGLYDGRTIVRDFKVCSGTIALLKEKTEEGSPTGSTLLSKGASRGALVATKF